MENVVDPLKLPASLNRDKVNRFLHDTDEGRVSRLVLTDRAQRVVTQKETSLTQSDITSRLMQRVTKRLCQIAIICDQVIRKASRGLLSNGRKFRELLNKSL
jgi:ribosomal protein L15E